MSTFISRGIESNAASSLEWSRLLLVKALQAFKLGNINLDTLLEVSQLAQAAGAPPAELLDVVEQQEAHGVLAEAARATLHQQLEAAQPKAAVVRSPRSEDSSTDVHDETSRNADTCLRHRYQICAVVSDRSTAPVYKARDTRSVTEGTPEWVTIESHASSVALKERQIRFEQLIALRHPGIARYLDYGADEGHSFVVAEYLEAPTLDEMITNGAMPRARAIPLIVKVAEALEAAHAASVVHGNLTLSSILVLPSNGILLTRFAMAADASGSYIGETKQSSPETEHDTRLDGGQAEPPHVADDVYALARVAQVLLGLNREAASGVSRAGAWFRRNPLQTPAQEKAIKRGLDPNPLRRTASVTSFMNELTGQSNPRQRHWRAYGFGALLAALLVFAVWFANRAPMRPPVVAATPHTTAWKAPGSRIKDCAECPLLSVVGPGAFYQGDNSSDSSFEKPGHQISIGYSFAVATYALTVGEFKRFADETGRDMNGCEVYDGTWRYNAAASWRLPNFVQTSRHPVTCVSWDDAMHYAAWISKKSGHHYRLPSSAEWEFVARAGESVSTPWRSPAEACRIGNVADETALARYAGWKIFDCEDGFIYTAPVGSFQANNWGLQDMLGNVMAWTADCWYPDYKGAPTDGSARLEDGCQDHELRGGSWFSNPAYVRASYRNHFAADFRSSSTGIRLVRDASP